MDLTPFDILLFRQWVLGFLLFWQINDIHFLLKIPCVENVRMKFPGCSHMASSQIYMYMQISLDPPSTTEILSQWSLALDVYRIPVDPKALQELFPQHIRHAEIPDATHGCALSRQHSIVQEVWSMLGMLDSRHDWYRWEELGAGASFQLLASILHKEGEDFE